MLRAAFVVLALLIMQGSVAQDTESIILFYLHGRIIEDEGPTPTHPVFGLYDYPAVVDALGARGADVRSEIRDSGTDVVVYALKIIGEIDTLIEQGTNPGNIVVAGFSKGGIIAAYVSSYYGRPDVRYVLLAACGDWMSSEKDLRLSGHVYSINDRSDGLATSCKNLARRSRHLSTYKEKVVVSNRGHGSFYLPHARWTDPVLDWIHDD